MTATYRAVAGRIRQDLDDIAAISGRVRAIWDQYRDTGDEYYSIGMSMRRACRTPGFSRMV